CPVRWSETQVAEADRLLAERHERAFPVVAALVAPTSNPLLRLACAAKLEQHQELTAGLAKRAEKARRHNSRRRDHTARLDRLALDLFPLSLPEPAQDGTLDARTERCAPTARAPEELFEEHLVLALFLPTLAVGLCVSSALLFRGGVRHYFLGVRLVR